MSVLSLSPAMLATAKSAFSTRRANTGAMKNLLKGPLQPRPGDLVLAQIESIGQHKRLQLSNGRPAQLFENDTVIVAYGHRYAPDQFEAEVPPNLDACHLAAAGGLARAACLAGVFSLEDGLRLIATRARLMQSLPQEGGMIAVMAAEERVLTHLQPYRQDVSIAAINGPESVVLSGTNAGIQAMTAILRDEGIRVTPLSVSHAFHSRLMEPILADFELAARAVDFSAPQIDLISNVSGAWSVAGRSRSGPRSVPPRR